MAESESRVSPRHPSMKDDPFDWFLRIPNRLELMKPIREMIRATLDGQIEDDEALQEVLLAFSEIVNNAIEHVEGSGENGYHEIDVWFGCRDGVMVGRVIDEGEGGIQQGDFDAAATPDLESDRGRGLFLIKMYVDEITVQCIPGVGTEVRISKRIGAPAEDGA